MLNVCAYVIFFFFFFTKVHAVRCDNPLFADDCIVLLPSSLKDGKSVLHCSTFFFFFFKKICIKCKKETVKPHTYIPPRGTKEQ